MRTNAARNKKTDWLPELGRYLLLTVAAVLVLVPVVWMFSTAFKPEAEIITVPPRWLPQKPTLEAFERFFNDYPFVNQLKNSLIFVVGSTVITVACACLAGYGVTRFQFKGKNAFMSFLLLTQMFPSIMLLVPYYTVLKTIGLLNTYLGIILVYVSINIAFCTWMMMGYFRSLPTDLDEAAIVDGCNRWQVFWKIILPLTLPGLASVAIYAFITGWNEYMFASILTTTDSMKTITIGIAELNGQYKVLWNDMMAASIIASLPLIILYMFMQKYFISGLTAGAVKG